MYATDVQILINRKQETLDRENKLAVMFLQLQHTDKSAPVMRREGTMMGSLTIPMCPIEQRWRERHNPNEVRCNWGHWDIIEVSSQSNWESSWLLCLSVPPSKLTYVDLFQHVCSKLHHCYLQSLSPPYQAWQYHPPFGHLFHKETSDVSPCSSVGTAPGRSQEKSCTPPLFSSSYSTSIATIHNSLSAAYSHRNEDISKGVQKSTLWLLQWERGCAWKPCKVGASVYCSLALILPTPSLKLEPWARKFRCPSCYSKIKIHPQPHDVWHLYASLAKLMDLQLLPFQLVESNPFYWNLWLVLYHSSRFLATICSSLPFSFMCKEMFPWH